MRSKSIRTMVAVATLLVAAFLYWTLPLNTYRVEDILDAYREHADYNDITLEHPLDGTLFPPEMVPPLFRWRDGAAACRAWLVRIELPGTASNLNFVTRRPRWTPPREDWEKIKRRSAKHPARVVILGLRPGRPIRVLSRARISFRTSRDPVGAPLFYREVELPFLEANKHLSRIRWRFGSIDSTPPIVLTGLPVCGNCHSFSADGATLAMDVDYASDKGSYAIAPVQQEMELAGRDIITWADFGDGDTTHGLLSRISPDGRYVISTVSDITVFVACPDPAFSQVFFPVKGILCVYDRQTKEFQALPGADDPAFIQSNPVWSPDGSRIVFARAPAPDLSRTKHQGAVWLTPNECKDFIADEEPFRFDLYHIPFNGGQGGKAEPLEGASHNGMSNFFARYSPDGRWIVFCRARSYMLLQPDSELYIIGAQGGLARRLRCNTPRMNSWHSFSPNGKWLVFASKAYSDHTQLCLTHIDENGNSTPPVLLAHLTAPDRAANTPEFVNADPQAIAIIRARFLRDH